MPTLMDSIEDKYVGDDNSRDYGFIVFVSESPECKKGMFPPIMTLCDFDIEAIGKLSHLKCFPTKVPRNPRSPESARF